MADSGLVGNGLWCMASKAEVSIHPLGPYRSIYQMARSKGWPSVLCQPRMDSINHAHRHTHTQSPLPFIFFVFYLFFWGVVLFWFILLYNAVRDRGHGLMHVSIHDREIPI